MNHLALPNILFWVSFFVSLLLLVVIFKSGILIKSKKRKILKSINGLLLVLFPFLVVVHVFDHFLNHDNLIFVILESLFFPFYIIVLVLHIYMNWSYFKND